MVEQLRLADSGVATNDESTTRTTVDFFDQPVQGGAFDPATYQHACPQVRDVTLIVRCRRVPDSTGPVIADDLVGALIGGNRQLGN